MMLWAVTIAANASAAAQLYRLALYRRYPCFFAYLVFTAARSLLLLAAHGDSHEIISLLTAPVLWIFQVLLVLEIYSLVLGDFFGIRSLGRVALYAVMFLSALVSLIVFPWRSEAPGLLFWSTGMELSVRVGVLVMALLLLMFLSRYPIVLCPNLLTHCVIYTIFFLNDSFPSLTGTPVSSVTLVISSACYVAWALLLTRAGETRRVQLH